MFKQKSLIALSMIITLLLPLCPFAAITAQAAYADDLKWEFKYTLDSWAVDEHEAGTDNGNLWGRIYFYGLESGSWKAGAGGSKEASFSQPKTGQKTTASFDADNGNGGYVSTPPWLISAIEIKNNSKNAYYCKTMRVWVQARKVGSSSNHKSAMVAYEYHPWQWIETGNKNRSSRIYWSDPFQGNGHQARHPQKINGWDDFTKTLYLNPAHGDSTVYTADLDGTFSGENYTSTFVGGDSYWKFEGRPTLKITASGTSGNGNDASWQELKDATAVSELTRHGYLSGFTINKKAMASYMNRENINTIKITSNLSFPWCTFSDSDLKNAGTNLGSDKFERTITIHRRALSVKRVNFYSGTETGGVMTLDNGRQQHAPDNYYFNKNSKNIIAEVEFYNHRNDDNMETTPERNSWQRYDEGWFQNYGWLGGSAVNSQAYLNIKGTDKDGKNKTVKLGGKLNKVVQIHKNGKAYFNFSLEGVEIETGVANALELELVNMQTDNSSWENDCYITEPGIDYTTGTKHGNYTYFSGKDKVDTISPYFKDTKIIDEDGYTEVNGWRKRVKFSYTPSEDLETRMSSLPNKGTETETLPNGKMYYAFINEKGNVEYISNYSDTGAAQYDFLGANFPVFAEAPAVKDKASEATISLRDLKGNKAAKESAGKIVALPALVRDIGFNRFEANDGAQHTIIKDVKLDTQAPRVQPERKEEYIKDQLITKLTYTFKVQDASKSGRVYYMFSTDSNKPANLADPNNTEGGKETGILEGNNLGQWFFIGQDYQSLDDYTSWDAGKGAAVLSCGVNQSFNGYIHYYTEDALGNRSEITTEEISVSTPDLNLSIIAQEENPTKPLANYTIDIITDNDTAKIEYRWQHPSGNGYITDWKPYSSATEAGSGTQYDSLGNKVMLNGSCTLDVRVTIGTSSPITDSKTIVYDNEEPQLKFTNTASGKYQPYHNISITAEDISGMESGTASIVYEDGADVPDSPKYQLQLTDAGTISDSVLVNNLPSGTYRIKAAVTDQNGTTTEGLSGAFYIRAAAPEMTVSAIGADKDGKLLTNSADYQIKLDVKESFKNPRDEQKLFYRVTNDIASWGPWQDASVVGGAVQVITDGYSFSGTLANPYPLDEGENELFIQAVMAPAGSTPSQDEGYAAEGSYKITLDTVAPTADIILEDVHTNTDIIGALKLIDAQSGSFTASVPADAKELVIITPVAIEEAAPGTGDGASDESSEASGTATRELENEFTITVKGNVDTVITAKDEAGNSVRIPIAIKGFDSEGPAYTASEPVSAAVGARVDTSVKIDISNAAKGTVRFAVIPTDKLSEAVDAEGKIKEEYFISTINTETAGNENEDAEPSTVNRAVELPGNSFASIVTYEALGQFAGEIDTGYELTLRGVTGSYAIGVQAMDSLGNVSDKVFDFTLSPQDAAAEITEAPVISPMVANTKTKVSLKFNVPVYILPQNLITTELSGEAENSDEANLEKARTMAGTFSREQSFLVSENGEYPLYVVDELGRASKMSATVEGVEFGNTDILEAKTAIIRVKRVGNDYVAYSENEASDWRREITGAELVAPGGGLIGDGSEDEYWTVVEVTAPDGYVITPKEVIESGYLKDDGTYTGSYGWSDDLGNGEYNHRNYMADDDLSSPVNPYEDPSVAGYTKLIYRTTEKVIEIDLENGNLHREYPDLSDIDIPVRFKSAATTDGTWEEATVTATNFDNSPPLADLMITPDTERGERTDEYWNGEPLRYTLGNVKIEGTIKDLQTGVAGIYLVANDESSTFEKDIDFAQITQYPYIITEEETGGMFTMRIDGTADDSRVKYVEIEALKNVQFEISAGNSAGGGSYIGTGAEGGIIIDYINKIDISDTDYTLSYEYQNANGEWLAISNEFEKNADGIWVEKEGAAQYYKTARVVLTPTADGAKRGIKASGSGVTYDSDKGAYVKELSSFANSFTLTLGDQYGYSSSVSGKLSMFDNTNGEISFTYDSKTITNRAIPITINVSDEKSGIGKVELIIKSSGTAVALTDNGSGSYTGSLSNIGTHIIRFTDGVGNVLEKSFTVTNIDTVVPTVVSTTWSIPPYQPNENLEGYSTQRTAGTVTAALTYSKTGVKITEYKSLSAELKETDFSVDTNNSVIRFRENGSVEITFVDAYGNVGYDIINANQIYKEPPALVAVPVLAADQTKLTVTFEKEMQADGVTPVDTRLLSDISVSYGGITRRAVEYINEKDENGNIKTVEKKAEYTFTENGIYTFRVFDDDGISSNLTINVSGIDRSAPTITSISWSYSYEKNEQGAWVKGNINETRNTSKEVREKDEFGNIKETGYRIATDVYPVTNQDVTVTITTDTATTIVGDDTEAATSHTLDYSLNGAHVFNVQKSNGTYDSYSLDVELIDKTAPVLELSAPEIIFYERKEMNKVPYDESIFRNLITKCYDEFDGKGNISLTDKVSISFTKEVDGEERTLVTANDRFFEDNIFNRQRPYYVTYTITDDAHNITEKTLSVRLIGLNDSIVLVNGKLPDYQGFIEISDKNITLELGNFVGLSYANVQKGRRTMGQMKKQGAVLLRNADGTYTFTPSETDEWYTFMVQTDKRDYFLIQVYYYQNGEER